MSDNELLAVDDLPTWSDESAEHAAQFLDKLPVMFSSGRAVRDAIKIILRAYPRALTRLAWTEKEIVAYKEGATALHDAADRYMKKCIALEKENARLHAQNEERGAEIERLKSRLQIDYAWQEQPDGTMVKIPFPEGCEETCDRISCLETELNIAKHRIFRLQARVKALEGNDTNSPVCEVSAQESI